MTGQCLPTMLAVAMSGITTTYPVYTAAHDYPLTIIQSCSGAVSQRIFALPPLLHTFSLQVNEYNKSYNVKRSK